MRYNNYHKHTHYSNISTIDVVSKPEDYMKRAVELGQNIYFTTEHGYTGNIYEAMTLAEKYNLKVVYGIEAYYVHDRKEKDKSNYHIILIALNDDGYEDLNRLMSESWSTGKYYKARIDDELLFSINPENVIVTTACVAGRLREENGRDEWIKKMKSYFKNNFYLEVQAHTCKTQAEYNKMILEYSKKYNIPIMHANDSHYIYPNEYIYRNKFLKGKGISYPEEDEFILDYPDSDTIIQRYKKQGILNESQINEALKNTLIFDKAEHLSINKEIKMPMIFDNPLDKLKEILNNAWKQERTNIKREKHNVYLDAIREETKVVEETDMAEYFLINYYIIKNAIEKYNGVITKTGRGSAPSFYINKLLGFTDIDRVSAPITLFPSRFMSKTRILETHSLPDIDFNCANTEPFYQASKDLLGEDNCYFMIAYKPLQVSSAFRLWCKANDLNINEYNDIAIDLAELSKVKKSYTESQYYQDEKWKKLIDDSQNFVGVIESIAQHPCSTLLMDEPISKKVGLVRAGDIICANITSYESDNYKYLKNDLLTVTVWDIINKTCKLASIKTPTILELDKLVDDKTWKIYENGLTCSINQVDSDYATGLVKTYKPKSVAELSAFVACIRPGCASLLQDFIHRVSYTTGVTALDDLLKDGSHRMIYQELIMKYLIWLGVNEDNSYGIIKKIAKKKFKEQELKELKEQLLNGWVQQVGTQDHFEDTWQIVEDAARYSFNCSHSLSYAYDSLYGAYLKSHYPLEYYTTALNFYQGDFDRTNKLTNELKFFGIRLASPKFRYSNDTYSFDNKTKTIYKGTSSIKGLSKVTGSILYEMKEKKYEDFYEFIIEARDKKIFLADIIILVKLNFFSEFGNRKKLLRIIDLYNEFNGKKTISKTKNYTVKHLILKDFCVKETEKQYSGFDSYKCIKYLVNFLNNNEEISNRDICKYELEYYGYISSIFDKENPLFWYVTDIISRGKNKLATVYSLRNGTSKNVKIKGAVFNDKPLEKNQLISISNFNQEGKWIFDKETEKWDRSKVEFEDYLVNYIVVEEDKTT